MRIEPPISIQQAWSIITRLKTESKTNHSAGHKKINLCRSTNAALGTSLEFPNHLCKNVFLLYQTRPRVCLRINNRFISKHTPINIYYTWVLVRLRSKETDAGHSNATSQEIFACTYEYIYLLVLFWRFLATAYSKYRESFIDLWFSIGNKHVFCTS